jgi:hypothetical protein
MAKIDFQKVEQYFDRDLARMEVENILYLAELSESLGDFNNQGKQPQKSKEQLSKEKEILVLNTKRELKFIARVRRDLIEKLGINRETAERLFKNPEKVSDDDIEEILEIREKIREFRAEVKKSLQESNIDEMIRKQIEKAKNKRFNIHDDWLPLK